METPAPQHDPPSLPGSPEPKRTKHIEPIGNISLACTHSRTRRPPSQSASLTTPPAILNDSAVTTPTPEALAYPPPAPPPAPTMSHSTLPPTVSHSTLPPMTLDRPPPALQVQLLSPTARAPTRGSAFAAGYDLYASAPATIPARGKALVDTDISIAVPESTYGRIAPRSGLAAKHGIDTGAGVIDADYRGPVKVLLFNLSDKDFEVAAGDRVAQLIVERICTPEVLVVEKLEESVRGAGGFGSTGGFAGVLPPVNGA